MQAETDKQRILALLEVEYEFVHRTIDKLSAETMLIPHVAGDWSIKDTLAHLTAWLRRLKGWLAEIAEGKAPNRPTDHTEEQLAKINAAQYTQDKELPLDIVIADFHNTYNEVYTLIDAISEEDLLQNTFNGLIHEPILQMVKDNTYEHFHEHIEPIRKWLAENQQIGVKLDRI